MQSNVTVFYATVPQSPDLITALSRVLNPDERTRSAHFAFDKHRYEFIMAHALLHYALWCKTGLKGWSFRSDLFGKPKIVPSANGSKVSFSLSHSGQLATCAVCEDLDMGIDVEEVREDFDFDEAATYFTRDEQAQISAQIGGVRSETFFRLWTLKEAIVKAIGQGLSMPLQSFTCTLEPLGVTISPAHSTDATHRWYIEQRKLSFVHWVSLAVPLPAEANVSVVWRPVPALAITSMIS